MFNTDLKNLFAEIDENTKVISDTHFNHEGILRFEECRLEQMVEDGFLKEVPDIKAIWKLPDSERKKITAGLLEYHTEWLVHKWNAEIQEDELVILMGDFAWKGMHDVIPRLNGRVILILGNHDRKGTQVYKDFEHVVRGFYLYEDLWSGIDNLMIAESTDELLSVLILKMKINGETKKVMFSHYPISITEEEWTKRTKNPNNVIQPRISALIKLAQAHVVSDNIHGHTHSRCVVSDKEEWFKYHNCSLENIDFKPITIKDLILKND